MSVPALSIADAAPVVEGVTSRFEVTLSASRTTRRPTVSVPALSIADAAPVVEGVTSRFEVTLSASSALRFEAGETAKTIEVATVDGQRRTSG